MARTLAIIAGTGIAVSAVCLALAAAFDDRHIGRLFSSCGEGNAVGVTGNTREIAWESDSDEVTINVPATVAYRPGTRTSLLAMGSPEALSHLRVRGSRIEFDCRRFDSENLDLVLPGRGLSDFTLNGSGRLVLEDLNLSELDVAIHGRGEVEASGRADDVDLTMAGAGEARLGGLAVKSMQVRIAGAGDAEVAPEEEVEIMIAGAGEIRLLTEPRSIEQNIFGAGKIVRVPRAPAP
jgi:hypothetical protein